MSFIGWYLRISSHDCLVPGRTKPFLETRKCFHLMTSSCTQSKKAQHSLCIFLCEMLHTWTYFKQVVIFVKMIVRYKGVMHSIVHTHNWKKINLTSIQCWVFKKMLVDKDIGGLCCTVLHWDKDCHDHLLTCCGFWQQALFRKNI